MTRALRYGASIGLLALLLLTLDGAATLRALQQVELIWVLAAAAALTLQTGLMALRWHWVCAALDVPMSLRRALGEYYLGQVVNATVPGGIVGDAGRAWRTRDASDLRRAAYCVMIERLFGQVFLFVGLGVGLAAAALGIGAVAWPSGLLATLGLALGLAGVGLAGLALWKRTNGFVLALGHSLRDGGRVWRQIALGGLILGLNLAAFAASARATGTLIPISGWLTLIPLILAAMLIPLSVGGWGWREGAAAALFPLIGASAADGVAAGVVFGGTLVLISLPGALWPIFAAPHAERLPQRGVSD